MITLAAREIGDGITCTSVLSQDMRRLVKTTRVRCLTVVPMTTLGMICPTCGAYVG